ncbi:hypothetical protein PsYK624_111750 [Phanerochaete sordida]|uniref:F-box domain-containing protein n=1 Tax=Phanerochaete sordida TaxID=48140 RepID=A0A9P3GHC2_9APHY|nr:hypothetical protein PsYK624_111750 [Phanerochaete sordida]
MPRLWSTFVVNCRRLAAALLARSKQAPLHVELHAISDVGLFWEPLQKQMHRVEGINIVGYPSCPYAFTYESLQAPRLRTLQINGCESLPSRGEYHMTPFDHVDLPCLTALYIEDAPVSWRAPMLTTPTLTHLSFTLSSAWQAISSSNIVHVLQVLKQLPRLEKLALIDTLPEVASPSPQEHAHLRATFPSLKHLGLRGSAPALTCILSHMSFPAQTRLALTCPEPEPHELARLARLVEDKLRAAGEPPPFRAASISDTRFHAWRADYDFTAPSSSRTAPRPDVTLALLLEDDAGFPRNGAVLAAACAAMPLRAVRTLYLGARCGTPEPGVLGRAHEAHAASAQACGEWLRGSGSAGGRSARRRGRRGACRTVVPSARDAVAARAPRVGALGPR